MYLFKNGRLFDGHTDHLLDGYEVLVEGKRIIEVSPTPIKSASATVIDLHGKSLLPGLIDAHFHCIAAHPDLSAIDDMPDSLLWQHARKFLEASLSRGFTTIRDAGGADYGLANAVDTGLISGPRLFYAGRALSQTGGHGDFRPFGATPALCACGLGVGRIARVADGVTEVRKAARDELRKGATQIKIMGSGGVASPSDPIWNIQYSEEEIRAVVWEAESWQKYVMAHAYTPEAITRCLEFGVRSIEHANLIDAPTAKLALEKGAFVVPTLSTYESLARREADLGFPTVSLEKLATVRDEGLSALDLLHTTGVKIGFGTDLLGSMHEDQLTEFEIRSRVLPPITILRQATSINAELLNKEGELGCIAPGAVADLIVVEGDPLTDIGLLSGQGEHISAVMKDGVLERNRM
ncbi:MAG: amidohydrolase family protein [Gammaproteobacteria bacterium]|nr:amidohydrolase family protein [Gammaproteobacteria bacterium]